MSAVDIAVREFRKLEPEDLQLLQAIEQQMKNYEYAPSDAIKKQSELPPQEIDYRIPLLIKKGLLQGRRGQYTGYSLTTAGYDTLAINALVKEDIIEAFGKPLGVGKESDVYDALTPDKQQVALKFHRLGRTSFNIILQQNQHILIIDWPQSVTTKHPNAGELLERDLRNVLTFFQRKYGLKNSLKDALDYVQETSRN